MSAITNLISLVANFINLIITGVQSVFVFGKMSLEYLRLFIAFIPVQFTALFLIVIIAALIYLILGR